MTAMDSIFVKYLITTAIDGMNPSVDRRLKYIYLNINF
jgi:hypothetical protein